MRAGLLCYALERERDSRTETNVGVGASGRMEDGGFNCKRNEAKREGEKERERERGGREGG